MFRKKNTSRLHLKRQWGAERRTDPLSPIHDIPSTRKIASSRLAIVLTIVLWTAYFVSTIIRQFFEGPSTFRFTMEAIGYLIVVTFLTFSALMYLIMRAGALQRFAKHVRVPRAEIDRYFSSKQPSITVLVPAVHEEPKVVRKTLLSAALQEYPKKRVMLLIDDNPKPASREAADRLEATRQLCKDITEELREPRERFTAALEQFERRTVFVKTIKPEEMKTLIEQYT